MAVGVLPNMTGEGGFIELSVVVQFEVVAASLPRQMAA
jgi:hypothetical protein